MEKPSGSLGAVAEAAGTTVGLYVARWVEPRLKKTLTDALEDLRLKSLSSYRTLVFGWKVDRGYRDTIDRNTILAITAINSLAGKITKTLGPFSEVADEIVERVVSAVPDILPEVLSPVADKFQADQGEAPPSRAQLEAAMRTYLQAFGEDLPRELVGHFQPLNPSRWLTKPGEVVQQASNSCGPLAMLAMAIFWMGKDENDQPILTDAEREEYAHCFFALNSEQEIENFLGLPNDASRKLYLKFVNELRQNRFFMSASDRARAYQLVLEVHRNLSAPVLSETARVIKGWRDGWRRDHPEWFQQPVQRQIHPRLAWAQRNWAYIVLGLIVIAAFISNAVYHN